MIAFLKRLKLRLRKQPLEIEVAGVVQSFADAEQFGEFLDLRLKVPTSSMEQLAGMDGQSLLREIRHTGRAYKNAVDIMVRSAETGLSVVRLWHQLDISRVPDDHEWPSILFAVGNAEQFPESFHRLTLAHYIRYLDARRNLLDNLHHELRKTEAQDGEPVMPHGMRHSFGLEPRFSTTRHSIYARLPRRHSINVDLASGSNLTVYLAHNRYLLKQDGAGLSLLGQDGVAHLLRAGRNTVGRSSHCDIRIETAQSDISREHLLIEVSEDGHVSLTDLSSRGTYVPPEILPARHALSVTGTNTIH
ncbi:MAG TPA: FHA domain-containing protein [Gammaproteobacteria bacterium]|nr:FHA domain-containing protein [Gammaproteobacteria bacterium]